MCRLFVALCSFARLRSRAVVALSVARRSSVAVMLVCLFARQSVGRFFAARVSISALSLLLSLLSR